MHVNIDFKAKEIELLDESFKVSDLLELLDNELFESFTVKAVVNIQCDCKKSNPWYQPYDITVNPIYYGSNTCQANFTSTNMEELMKEIRQHTNKE